MSLEEALDIVNDEIVPSLRDALPPDAAIRISGSADRLGEVVRSMGLNFVMALVVLFMLMAAMFRSLRDSAFVMATLPMAVLGGVAGLRVLDLVAGQTLDLLSMIGFIMLLGMVINNAILLVAQAREAQAGGASLDDALKQALDQRLRPILIAALTGVLGALPMAINPGPGAVIYRDGTMAIYDETATTAQELVDAGAWQTLSFGPALVDGGEIVSGIDQVEVDTNFGNHSIQGSQPRTAIGMVSANHYVFVVVDGRSGESTGVTMTELAEIMQSLGATVAYNLDGGGSSAMVSDGELVNNPLGKHRERGTSDILWFE